MADMEKVAGMQARLRNHLVMFEERLWWLPGEVKPKWTMVPAEADSQDEVFEVFF